MLEHTRVNRQICQAAAQDPALLATDLADYLVLKGIPFRKAHHTVGLVVALAERLNRPLNQLSLSELQTVEKKFDADALKVFDLNRAMGRRKIIGSPGAREVKRQLTRWAKDLKLARPKFSRNEDRSRA
jgi:argininosuccinate lyase